jgi:hypothetical protein
MAISFKVENSVVYFDLLSMNNEQIVSEINNIGELIKDVKCDNELVSPTNYELKKKYYKEAYVLVKELKSRDSESIIPMWIRIDLAYQNKLKKAQAFRFSIKKEASYETYSGVLARKYVYFEKEYEDETIYFKVDKNEFLDTIFNLHLISWGGREFIKNKDKKKLDWFVEIGYTYDNRDKLGGIQYYPSGINFLFSKLEKWSEKRIKSY